jgi:LPXTG-motif cell wall-anchored protein
MLAWLTVAAAAVSAVGIAIILIGIAFDIEGAQEGEAGPAIFGVAWISYLLAGIAALILGAAALVVGRRRNDPATTRAGIIALGYVVLAIIIFMIA